jgi:uncharacterized protein (DUF305 family)
MEGESKLARRFLAVLVGGAFFAAACGAPGDTAGSSGSGAGSAASTATAARTDAGHGGHGQGHGGDAAGSGTAQGGLSYDQRFIAGMTPHHESAIEMAEVALERAEHPEIKELAREIIQAQRAENTRMAGWYEEWYGGEIPEGMDHSMPGMGAEGAMGVSVEELRRADPFDRAFIDAMIPHHEAAVEMARDARENAERPELRELASQIIEAQEREIGQLRRWRAEWYGS